MADNYLVLSLRDHFERSEIPYESSESGHHIVIGRRSRLVPYDNRDLSRAGLNSYPVGARHAVPWNSCVNGRWGIPQEYRKGHLWSGDTYNMEAGSPNCHCESIPTKSEGAAISPTPFCQETARGIITSPSLRLGLLMMTNSVLEVHN
jgi:hypothetical protein